MPPLPSFAAADFRPEGARRPRALERSGRAAAWLAVALALAGGELCAQDVSGGARANEVGVAFGAEGIVTIPGEELADFVDLGFGVASFLEFAPGPAWRFLGRLEVALYGGESPGDDVAGPDSSWLTSLGAGIVVRP